MTPPATLQLIGGPTALLRVGGLKLLTDPTFDPPQHYEPRPGVELTKLQGPAVTADELGHVDAVLLSHDHHVDNLDRSGREFLSTVPRVLTTVSGALRLGDIGTPLPIWYSTDLQRPDGSTLRVTGVPARHGPPGSEQAVGDVIGFVLSADDTPTIYVSGDNQSLEVVRQVRKRLGPIDVAVLFAGGAQLPYVPDAFLTLTAAAAVEAATILGARRVVPMHTAGWAHLTEGPPSIRTAFREAGLGERLVLVDPGSITRLEPAVAA